MSAPAPETRIEQTPEWLLVHARGVFALAWFKQLIQQAIAAAQTSVPPARAMLLDLREVTGARMSDMDRYDLGVLAARDSVGAPIAMVGPETLVDPRRFGEVVARNRGLNVRVFTDMDEATAWLRSFTKT
ncbi:MAG TPA: hypothetical protein VGQ18_01115 [Gemmatimonadales bacterium]|nr:hypothetical protein [Gemmatimonadales bacterium]